MSMFEIIESNVGVRPKVTFSWGQESRKEWYNSFFSVCGNILGIFLLQFDGSGITPHEWSLLVLPHIWFHLGQKEILRLRWFMNLHCLQESCDISSKEDCVHMLWLIPQYFAFATAQVMFYVTAMNFLYTQVCIALLPPLP